MSDGLALRAISPREASIYACLVDTVCDPQGELPAVWETTAVSFFDCWLSAAPRLNRVGYRALLYLVEVGPLLAGYGARLRRLEPERRQEFALEAEASSRSWVTQATKLARVAASLSYYGDTHVMRVVGYDPEAKLARSRELRREEGRP
jgi:hypothetical protein